MHILSFDIEEWFHLLDHPEINDPELWDKLPSRIEENLERILGIVSDANVKATFFCLGWIAEKYPHLVKKIAAHGYEIGSHSHLHQLAYDQSPDSFRQDLRKSLDILGDITGRKVTLFRVPGFSLTKNNLWLFDVLLEEGIEIDCSVFPTHRGHGGLPMFPADQPCKVVCSSGELLEFPINLQKLPLYELVFSGGGYFRLLPYWALRGLFARSEYVMTYFHPRDFDAGQPVIDSLPWHRKFKSYVGLKKCEPKLKKLLYEFDFVDIREAVVSYNWNEAQIINLKQA